MKAYLPSENDFDYPEDMAIILAYLMEHGTLNMSPNSVEKYYRKFCDELYAAGWMELNDYILEEFASWLAEVTL